MIGDKKKNRPGAGTPKAEVEKIHYAHYTPKREVCQDV